MFNFKKPERFIDFRKIAYEQFLYQAKNVGVFYFLGVNTRFLMARNIDESSEESNKIPDIPLKFFFPQLGSYILLSYADMEEKRKKVEAAIEVSQTPEDTQALKELLYTLSMPSLRHMLKRNYPFYEDDLINFKLYLDNKLMIEVENTASDLVLPKEDIFAIAGIEKMTKVQLTLKATGFDRKRHEIESLIFETEEYLKFFNLPENQYKLLAYLKETNPDLFSERKKIWNLTDLPEDLSNFSPITLSFNKVFSFENFYNLFHLSKYSNAFLLDLDKDTRNEVDHRKMLDVLTLNKN